MLKTTVVAWKQRATTATVLGKDVCGGVGDPPAHPHHKGCAGSIYLLIFPASGGAAAHQVPG